jgi:hypothetical protein
MLYFNILLHSVLCTAGCEADTNFAAKSICLLAHIFRNEVVNNSQITGGVENVVPLHVDIPRTSGRCSDLPSADVLQEYMKFFYECFLSILLQFEGYCCKLCLQTIPEEKITSIKIS